VLLLRERLRAARPSSRVDRLRLSATAALDGWPPARVSGCTEPGLQADSPAARSSELHYPVESGSSGHICLGKHPVKRITRPPARLRDEVPVKIDCRRDRLVPEPPRDLRNRYALGQSRAGERVPQIMKSRICRHACGQDRRSPDLSVVIVAPQQIASWRPAQDLIRLQAERGNLPPDRLRFEPRERDIAHRRHSLGRREDWTTADENDLLIDANHAGYGILAINGQAERLTLAQSQAAVAIRTVSPPGQCPRASPDANAEWTWARS
jgi:hypothetical protein